MAGTREDRLAVADRINAVQYREYASVGWLKVVSLVGMVRYNPAGQAAVHRWHVERDERACIEALDTILENDMSWSVPESVGTPSVDGDRWEPVTEAHARRIVDAILTGSSAAYPPAVPYEQLRTWFFEELFDPAAVRFFAPANGPPFDRHHRPTVAGIDHDVAALFWLE